tara:strand:+ start:13363 stop:14355 length:993 start_codon:yes stop_codon:yes gene_type:complete
MVLATTAVGLLAASSILAAESYQVSQPEPYIIDTDMDFDDWFSILYLVNNPNVDVKAITVTGTGVASCETGVDNALRLLALAGKSGIPVACGKKKPLHGDLLVEKDYRDTVDNFLGLEMPNAKDTGSDEYAVELMRRTLSESNKPVNIIALGPLSNIESLLYGYDYLKPKVKRLYIMGGAVDVPGNVKDHDNKTAEWNVYADPHAAIVVLHAGVPITLVPLDATNQVPISKRVYNDMAKQQQSSSAKFIVKAMAKEMQMDKQYFWDPLVAVIATNPEIATVQPMRLKIIVKKGPDYARTVKSAKGSPVDVVTKVDEKAFDKAFIDTVNQG